MEELRILHTNDLHSHFEKFPKIGRFFKMAQADPSFDQVLTFDAGDFMDRSHPLTDATKGHFNIRLMNNFNYDAITIGNNEGISNSHQVLEHLFDHAQFPVILANLREEDESMPKWCVTDKILTTNKGTKIAIIGLTAPYPMTYGPNHWHVKMLSAVLPDTLKRLKGHYDALFAITHIGLKLDEWLACNYPEFDLIIGGHSHDYLPEGKKVNRTWIVQTGKWGEHIGDITMKLDDNHKITSIVPATHSTSKMTELPSDRELIQSYFELGKQMLEKEKIADLPEKFAHNKDMAIAASLNAIADFAGTKIAMLSSGLFLTPFKKGILTEFDLQNALPHPMHVVKSTLKGSDLWRLVMEIEKNRHYLDKFPLKGMSFRGKVFGQMHYKGIKVDIVHRLVYVNGQEINPKLEYEIAVLDHYVLVPFFPTLSIAGENEFLFPQFLREVVGKYLAKKYPIKKGEISDRDK